MVVKDIAENDGKNESNMVMTEEIEQKMLNKHNKINNMTCVQLILLVILCKCGIFILL